jgi:hypothetical protein
MNEVSYFAIRAQHHSQLAIEASDPDLKAAYEAIAADMLAKGATADPNRKVVLVDGVAVDTYWSPGQRPVARRGGHRRPGSIAGLCTSESVSDRGHGPGEPVAEICTGR